MYSSKNIFIALRYFLCILIDRIETRIILKAIVFLFLFFIATFLHAQAPGFNWVNGMGSDTIDVGRSLTTDDLGNVYVTGSFQKTVDFDPGPDTCYLTSNGYSDICIQKINPNGDLIWALSIGGILYDVGTKIDITPSGQIVICGVFEGTVDFDPGIDTAYLISGTHTTSFILKLDTSGSYVWAGAFPGYYSYPTDLCIDSDGNTYTVGYFTDTVDFDPSPSVFELTATGPGNWWDIYIQKMDSSNNFVWAKRIGGPNDDYSTNIELDPQSNILVNGEFWETCDFDPGPGTYNLTSTNLADFFLLKLDSNGEFQWAFSLGSSTADYGYSLSVDNSGNIYSYGRYGGTMDFDPGPGVYNLTSTLWDVFIQKLDSNGNFLWAKTYEYSMGMVVEETVVDDLGSIYSIGHYVGEADFNPDTGVYLLDSIGVWDIFVHKLDSSGEFCWAKGMGGQDFDDGRGISLDDYGGIYLTGYFQDTAYFSNGSPGSTIVSNGMKDMFILKLDSSYNSIYITYQNTCFGDTSFFVINSQAPSQTVFWDFGDTASGVNNTSTLTNPGHVFTSPGLFTVTATVTTGTIANIYSTIIDISAGPESGVFTAGTDSVCQGQSNVLYAIASINEADSILWSLTPNSAGTIIGGDTIIHISFSPSFYGSAVLSACGINECGTGDSTLFNINVIGNPVSEAGPSAIICEDIPHMLSGLAQNYSVSCWATTGDGTFDDPFILDATYTPGPDDIEHGGVYLVLYAFAIQPCIYAEADTMLLTIKLLPDKPQTPIGPTQIILEPGLTSDYYTNSSTDADEYIWHLNPIESGLISGLDTAAVIIWNENFTGSIAYLNVDALNDCGGISSDTLVINLSPVGLDEGDWIDEQISIRPNPSDGIFNIGITFLSEEVELSVFSSNGVRIRKYKIQLSDVDNSFILDLHNQPTGIYYLHFSGNGSGIVKKVLVNRKY